MSSYPLHRIAKTIRSKNAGPFLWTFDIIFDDPQIYAAVRDQELITKESIGTLMSVREEDITHLITYDPANAIKITVRRSIGSGDVGDTDVYGCQQFAPLLDLPVVVDDALIADVLQ
jgi:hypothetical protein